MNIKSNQNPYDGGDDAVPAVAYLVRPPSDRDRELRESRPWASLSVQSFLIEQKATADRASIVAMFIDDAKDAYSSTQSVTRTAMDEFAARRNVAREYRVVDSPDRGWIVIRLIDEDLLDAAAGREE